MESTAAWTYSAPRWEDARKRTILVDISGEPVRIVADEALLHYRTIRAMGLAIAEPEVSAGEVKDEARRRILERFPEWKQQNMTARGVELQDIRREKGTWTIEEAAEAAALREAWAWIRAVRAASNAIEAIKPIPADYAAPDRWPPWRGP